MLWEEYPNNRILVLRPAAEIRLAGDRPKLLAGLTHVVDAEGVSATDATLRAGARLTGPLILLMGVANAPAISESTEVDARSDFAGVSLALTERFSVTASYAREERGPNDPSAPHRVGAPPACGRERREEMAGSPHGLAGSGGSLGFAEASARASGLEDALINGDEADAAWRDLVDELARATAWDLSARAGPTPAISPQLRSARANRQ